MSAHRDGAGKGTTHNGRGDDAGGISRGEGNSTLGDEGCTQQPGGLAVLALGLAEELGAQGGGQGHGQRRDHTRDDDGGHDFLVHGRARGQTGGCEEVSSLVDGATQVRSHHGTQDQAEQQSGTTGHGGQPILQGGHNPCEGRTEQQVHCQAGHQRSHERSDNHGHHGTQPAG